MRSLREYLGRRCGSWTAKSNGRQLDRRLTRLRNRSANGPLWPLVRLNEHESRDTAKVLHVECGKWLAKAEGACRDESVKRSETLGQSEASEFASFECVGGIRPFHCEMPKGLFDFRQFHCIVRTVQDFQEGDTSKRRLDLQARKPLGRLASVAKELNENVGVEYHLSLLRH